MSKLLKSLFAFCLVTVFAAAAFAQTGGIKGKISNQKGSGLAEVSVTARKDGENVKTVKSDAKGNFVLSGLNAGSYNVVFEKSGYSSAIKYDVKIAAGEIKNLGGNLFLIVDSGSVVILNGSVFNQDGRSLTGAKVLIERVNSDGSTKKVSTAYTSVSGEWTLRQPPGTAKYRVTASFKGVSGSKEISVDSAGIYRLAIQLTIPRED